ncbi:MAG: ATP-binding protein [Halanaerobium sp.]
MTIENSSKNDNGIDKNYILKVFSSLDNLIIYRNLNKDKIIFDLKNIILNKNNLDKSTLKKKFTELTARLIEFTEKKGLNDDIWHNYLIGLIINDLNSFTKKAEKREIDENSTLYSVTLKDIELLTAAFNISFLNLLEFFNMDHYNFLFPYQADGKNKSNLDTYKNLFSSIKNIDSKSITADPQKMINSLLEFYNKNGAAVLNKSSAFYWKNSALKIVKNPDKITFKEIIAYQKQKDKLIANTESFLKGKKAHNVLLYGDSGTGKSSSVKALLNEYQNQGLRLIEISSNQIKELPQILEYLSQRGLYFIIFMDDLSFEEFETEYKYLKAVMEGGIELKPDNVLFYATSNRRHLVREKWQDRESEVHKNDILNEKLSLAERFGLTLMYNTPAQEEYLKIVREIAEQENIKMDKNSLEEKALKWSQWNNGRSGRSARQFVDELLKNRD